MGGIESFAITGAGSSKPLHGHTRLLAFFYFRKILNYCNNNFEHLNNK